MSRPPVRRWRRAVIVAATLLIPLLVFLLWPSPIDAIVIEPIPTTRMDGPLAPNDALLDAEILLDEQVDGPEDVDIDREGRIYAGTADGRIIRRDRDGKLETFAKTGGRPFGIDFDASGNLIVCDGIKGLLSIDPTGKIHVLATECDGVPFGFTDDVEVGRDGVIYFSDASSKFGVGRYTEDLLEGRPHGRLLAYDPDKEQVQTLLDDLHFANGIAVDPDSRFVLVNETYRYRVTRRWLKGKRKGLSDSFVEHLPGFPDGISSGPRDTFWLAMFTVRNEMADRLAPYPWLRNQMAKLPDRFRPKPAPYGLVVELDQDGKILRSLHDARGEMFGNITSAEEVDGFLYLGTLLERHIGRIQLSNLSD